MRTLSALTKLKRMRKTHTMPFFSARLGKITVFWLLIGSVSFMPLRSVLADSYSLNYTENDVQTYDATDAGNLCTSTSTTTGAGTSTLSGYALPAASGKTGNEQAVLPDGHLDDGGGRESPGAVTFYQFASKGQAWRDYYITMRWTYDTWNWNGSSVSANGAELTWMKAQPRLVLVTNPRTGKSIIADALESGPAPWTGVDTSPNNNPKQGWTNPQNGTPSSYTGRVSGFPPTAINALGAKQGMSDGSGDNLVYSWAPDQNAIPGPTTVSSSTGGTPNPNCNSTGGPSVTDNVVWYSQYDPSWAKTSVWCGTFASCGCYITDIAMIASTFKQKAITPPKVIDTFIFAFGTNYGLQVSTFNPPTGRSPSVSQMNTLISELQKGNGKTLFLAHGNHGVFWDPVPPDPKHEHWVIIRGVSIVNNVPMLLVNDPADLIDPSNPAVPAQKSWNVKSHTYTQWPISAFTTNAWDIYEIKG